MKTHGEIYEVYLKSYRRFEATYFNSHEASPLLKSMAELEAASAALPVSTLDDLAQQRAVATMARGEVLPL